MSTHAIQRKRAKLSKLEAAVNHVIINGAKIAEGSLGTILPTAASERAGDLAARRNAKLNSEAAAKQLAGCDRRTVNGEVRYYRTDTRYAVMRNQVARWFEVRADGDYATR